MSPHEVDYATPNIARMYDYMLGGKSHGQADRELADRLMTIDPGLSGVLRANRAFLRRVVGYLSRECGIRQFLDIGTGLPTADNTHQVAQEADVGCRVIYVDNDVVVVRHAEALLAGSGGRIGVAQGDLREPEAILSDPETRRLIDFSEPVGVLLIAILPFLTDDDRPHEVVRTLMNAVPPGSFLALTHAETVGGEDLNQVADTYTTEARPLCVRSYTEIEHFFDGLELLEPGLVPVPEWRPDEGEVPHKMWLLGGVGRKP